MIKNKLVYYIQQFWARLNMVIVLIGYKFYFKRWQVVNYPKMKKNDAVIYVANHQNAFLDALSIYMSQNRLPIFLVRANIFATAFARFILRSWNMFPIYRIRDGAENLAKNDKIVQDCIDILIDGRQPLAIFVEGNHSMMRSLRPIKKGVGRIALSAIEQTDFNLSLKIIPIGISYSRHTRFRSDLLVNYGEAILVNDYRDLYEENQGKAYLQLTKDIFTGISKLVVNIADRQNYEEIEKAWISDRVCKDNMLEELHNDQMLIKQLIAKKAKGEDLEIQVSAKPKRKSILAMIFGFPLFAYGALNHLPIMFIIDRLLSKVVTDVHFYGSIKLAGGVYLGGFIYLLQSSGVYVLSGGNLLIASIYFVSLPFMGSFAYDYYLNFFANEPHTDSSADLLKGYK